MKDKEIYSNKITNGNRTYFFEIKKSENGDFYLKISESMKTSSGFEPPARSRIPSRSYIILVN